MFSSITQFSDIVSNQRRRMYNAVRHTWRNESENQTSENQTNETQADTEQWTGENCCNQWLVIYVVIITLNFFSGLLTCLMLLDKIGQHNCSWDNFQLHIYVVEMGGSRFPLADSRKYVKVRYYIPSDNFTASKTVYNVCLLNRSIGSIYIFRINLFTK